MEDEEFAGCISCMGTNDLYDLFAAYEENTETYACLLETCFGLKVSHNLRYMCGDCAEQLEKSVAFKELTSKNIALWQTIKDEEYLDESILEEEEHVLTEEPGKAGSDNDEEFEEDLDEEYAIQALDETTCIYCSLQLSSAEQVHEHVRAAHAREPRTGRRLRLRACRHHARCALLRPTRARLLLLQ